MHNHFSQYLDLQKFILERKPRVIVECGAGTGELTRRIESLLEVYDFTLFSISDSYVYNLDPRIKFIRGLSYKELKNFSDNSIDLCIIDTDHNFWTLIEELNVLSRKIKEGGLIAMHDVETFYHDSGFAKSYATGDTYPMKEIEEHAKMGGLGTALIAFLFNHWRRFKLLAYTNESQGAAIIEKKTVNEFKIYVPGKDAIYAEKNEDVVSV